MAKQYDRKYFDRWYRDPRSRLRSAGDVARKVHMVLAMAEHVLERRVRTVLDVGCGEGTWQPVLRRLRPGVSYTGVDESEYVVRRFGARRHIRRGSFGRLEAARLRARYDLIVVCDVLHYLDDVAVRRGLAFLAPRLEGLAYLEAYTSNDAIEGDKHDFRRRPAAAYRHMFRAAGFAPIGMHCYVGEEMKDALTALELPGV
jgi:SAM-dependent methyltransferase